MVVRFEDRDTRAYATATISALERASGAPRWLCEWVWLESLEQRKIALGLLKRLAPFPLSHGAARAALDGMDTPLQRARARGRKRAKEDLQSGRFYWLGSGLLREPPSFCPSYRVCIAFSITRADTCVTCGTPVFHSRSTGCRVEPGTRPYVEGYRAEVDAYLRERFPEFSWKDFGY